MTARLAWLATVNPAMLALSLMMTYYVVSKTVTARNAPAPSRPAEIGYSTFLDHVKRGQVIYIHIHR